MQKSDKLVNESLYVDNKPNPSSKVYFPKKGEIHVCHSIGGNDIDENYQNYYINICKDFLNDDISESEAIKRVRYRSKSIVSQKLAMVKSPSSSDIMDIMRVIRGGNYGVVDENGTPFPFKDDFMLGTNARVIYKVSMRSNQEKELSLYANIKDLALADYYLVHGLLSTNPRKDSVLKRRKQDISALTNSIVFDFDSINGRKITQDEIDEWRQRAIDYPHTEYFYRSGGGKGFVLAVKIDSETLFFKNRWVNSKDESVPFGGNRISTNFPEIWEATKNKICKDLNLTTDKQEKQGRPLIDSSCSEFSRIRYLSYDPKAYYNFYDRVDITSEMLDMENKTSVAVNSNIQKESVKIDKVNREDSKYNLPKSLLNSSYDELRYMSKYIPDITLELVELLVADGCKIVRVLEKGGGADIYMTHPFSHDKNQNMILFSDGVLNMFSGNYPKFPKENHQYQPADVLAILKFGNDTNQCFNYISEKLNIAVENKTIVNPSKAGVFDSPAYKVSLYNFAGDLKPYLIFSLLGSEKYLLYETHTGRIITLNKTDMIAKYKSAIFSASTLEDEKKIPDVILPLRKVYDPTVIIDEDYVPLQYHPLEEEKCFINSFKPPFWRVNPYKGDDITENDFPTIYKVISNLFNGEKRGIDYFIHGLAYMYMTGKKLRRATLFRTRGGTGKNTLMDNIVNNVLGGFKDGKKHGDNYIKLTSPEFFAKFGSEKARYQCIFVDEFQNKGDKVFEVVGSAAHLKTVITEDTCIIEDKFQDRVEAKNRATYFFASNIEESNSLAIDDEARRFIVIQSETKLIDVFPEIGKDSNWLDRKLEGEYESFQKYLSSLQINMEIASQNVYDTEAKKRLLEANLNGISLLAIYLKRKDLDRIRDITNSRIFTYDKIYTSTKEGYIVVRETVILDIIEKMRDFSRESVPLIFDKEEQMYRLNLKEVIKRLSDRGLTRESININNLMAEEVYIIQKEDSEGQHLEETPLEEKTRSVFDSDRDDSDDEAYPNLF